MSNNRPNDNDIVSLFQEYYQFFELLKRRSISEIDPYYRGNRFCRCCINMLDDNSIDQLFIDIIKLFDCDKQTFIYASVSLQSRSKYDVYYFIILITGKGIHVGEYLTDENTGNKAKNRKFISWNEINDIFCDNQYFDFLNSSNDSIFTIPCDALTGAGFDKFTQEWTKIFDTIIKANMDCFNHKPAIETDVFNGTSCKTNKNQGTANTNDIKTTHSAQQYVTDKYNDIISILEKCQYKIIENQANNSKLDILQDKYFESLETEIDKAKETMNSVLNGMVWDNLVIAFFGETNAGKSTIIETLRILFDQTKIKHNDGLIVGDGRSDFTKTYDEYHLNIFGKPFTLIDVPGIEGKEEDFKDDIKRALQQAHVVFYVQGHNKKPDSATAEKIKKYLNDWVNVYSIYNVRGSASNYDEDEERNNLYSSDVNKTYSLIEDTFKDILGDVYKGNIAVQALLAMCSKASFSSKREDLQNTQNKLIHYFKTADNLYNFSRFQKIVDLINEKTNNFDKELIDANLQKVYSLCRKIINHIQECIDKNKKDAEKLKNSLSHYRDDANSIILDAKNRIDSNCGSEHSRCFSSLQNDLCAFVDDSDDLDDMEEYVSLRVSEFQDEYSSTIESVIEETVSEMNQRLIDKEKEYLDCYDGMKEMQIDQIDIDQIDPNIITKELKLSFGNVLGSVATLGGAIGLGALGGPIGAIIGAGVWGIGKFIHGLGEDNRGKQKAKENIRQQCNKIKATVFNDLKVQTDQICKKIQDSGNELQHKLNRDTNTLSNIIKGLKQTSKDLENYSQNF